LIVLVHGCCTKPEDVSEYHQLADKMVGRIIQEEFTRFQKKQQPRAWEIVVWNWSNQTTPTSDDYVLCPKCFLDDADKAYKAAYDHDGKQGQSGDLAAVINSYSTYKYIHLIGHSAGAKLIHEASKTLAEYKNREGGEKPFIHLTFLDAYTQDDKDSGKDPNEIRKSYGYLEGYPNH